MGAHRAPKFLLQQPQVFAGFSPDFPRPCFAFVGSLGLYDRARQLFGTRAPGDSGRVTQQGIVYKFTRQANGGLDFGTVQPITSDAFTIIALANAGAADGISTLYSQRVGSPTNAQIDLLLNSTNATDPQVGIFSLYTSDGSGNRSAQSNLATLVDGKFHVYGATKAASGSAPALWYDGTVVASTTAAAGSGGTVIHSAQKTKLGNIGDYAATADYCAASDLAVVLCFNSALSTSQMRALTESLTAPYKVFKATARRLTLVGVSTAADVTIAATVGNAIAAGVSAQMHVTISALIGNAAAFGLSANIATEGTVSAFVGNAAAAGLAASIASILTVAASVGSAAATGQVATVLFDSTIAALIGNGVAAGRVASVGVMVAARATAEQLTIDALKASLAVAALVGSGDQLRAFPDEADQSAIKPYIVFERIGSAPETYLDFARAPVKVMMLITIWADSRMVAAQVATAVEDAMREAYHMLTDRTGSDVPDLREFAEALSFDIWEF